MLPFRDCLHVHTSAGWFGKAEGNARLEVTSSAVMSFGEVGISPSAGIWAPQHPALQHVGEAGLLILFPLCVHARIYYTQMAPSVLSTLHCAEMCSSARVGGVKGSTVLQAWIHSPACLQEPSSSCWLPFSLCRFSLG